MLEGDSLSLIIVGIRGLPASHGGFETFAERLSLFLRDRGWKVTVYCQGSETGRLEEDYWEGIKRIHVPVRSTGSVGTIEFDAKCTYLLKREPGVILTLGYNTGFLSTWLKINGRVNYINMDGMEWKREKYGRVARAYLWLNERLAAHSGTQLIADHPSIASHLSTRVSADKIATIPYGGDLIIDAEAELLRPLGLAPDEYMTLIARPVPENSILEIVKAFSSRPRGTKLVVLGTYNRNETYLAEILAAASDEVVFPGSIYEKPLLRALRFYSVAYLHGHRVGGTNPSLVEALGAGNAVIAHDNPFNRWVLGDAGLFFSDENSCDICISQILTDSTHRDLLRTRARIRWEQDFTWEKVLTSYEQLLTSS